MWQSLFDLDLDAQARKSARSALTRKILGTIIRRMVNVGSDPLVRAKIHGAEMILPISHMLPRYVALHPYYDTALPALAKFLLDQLPANQALSVIDVGANVGDTAVLIAHACGKDHVRITCIEADKAYLPLLRENTKDLKVTVYEAIAAAETNEVNADIVRAGGTSSVVAGGNKHRAIKLDDLTETSTANLIKIDTDGFEYEVIRGLRRTLAERGPMIFLEFAPTYLRDYGQIDPILVLRLLIESGFTQAIIWDHTGYPMMTTELRSDVIEGLTSYCLIKPGFYIDILVSKDSAPLRQFYEHDLKRYSPVEKH